MSEKNGWTLEAIFQLGGGAQVAIASTAPLRARDWYYLGRMLDVTREVAADRQRLDAKAAGQVTPGAAGEEG